MIDKLKNYTLIALGVLCLLIACWAVYERAQKEKALNDVRTVTKTITTAAKILYRYTEKNGVQHAVISGDANKTAVSGTFVDSTAEALKVSKDKLQEITQINSFIQAKNLKAEKMIDSLQKVTFFYQDKYLRLAYHSAQKSDSTDNGSFDFAYNDSLNIVRYWKRSWFLGAKKNFIDISSADSRTVVNSVKHLTFEDTAPAFGLRLQAVVNYNFEKQLVNVGPGLQFDFKRFSVIGTYYYDLETKTFKPSLGARYDVFHF